MIASLFAFIANGATRTCDACGASRYHKQQGSRTVTRVMACHLKNLKQQLCWLCLDLSITRLSLCLRHQRNQSNSARLSTIDQTSNTASSASRGRLPEGLQGQQYFIHFLDDYTRRIWVSYLRTRTNETLVQVFQVFITVAEGEIENKVRHIHADNEFNTGEMISFCQSKGISTPQQQVSRLSEPTDEIDSSSQSSIWSDINSNLSSIGFSEDEIQKVTADKAVNISTADASGD